MEGGTVGPGWIQYGLHVGSIPKSNQLSVVPLWTLSELSLKSVLVFRVCCRQSDRSPGRY